MEVVEKQTDIENRNRNAQMPQRNKKDTKTQKGGKWLFFHKIRPNAEGKIMRLAYHYNAGLKIQYIIQWCEYNFFRLEHYLVDIHYHGKWTNCKCWPFARFNFMPELFSTIHYIIRLGCRHTFILFIVLGQEIVYPLRRSASLGLRIESVILRAISFTSEL